MGPSNYLLSLIYPPLCVACQAPLQKGEPVGLCPSCFKQLPHWVPSEMGQVQTPELPRTVDSFDAPFVYEDPIRSLVRTMKYQDKGHLSEMLAGYMVPQILALKEAFLKDNISAEDVLLMPVPVHRWRLLWRLYNQSALLAQALSKQTSLACDVLNLKRIKYRKAQAQRTQRARRTLKADDFKASSEAVTGKVVILIDDIYTTGSTAKACAQALKRAGANAVHVRTVAYVALS